MLLTLSLPPIDTDKKKFNIETSVYVFVYFSGESGLHLFYFKKGLLNYADIESYKPLFFGQLSKLEWGTEWNHLDSTPDGSMTIRRALLSDLEKNTENDVFDQLRNVTLTNFEALFALDFDIRDMFEAERKITEKNLGVCFVFLETLYEYYGISKKHQSVYSFTIDEINLKKLIKEDSASAASTIMYWLAFEFKDKRKQKICEMLEKYFCCQRDGNTIHVISRIANLIYNASKSDTPLKLIHETYRGRVIDEAIKNPNTPNFKEPLPVFYLSLNLDPTQEPDYIERALLFDVQGSWSRRVNAFFKTTTLQEEQISVESFTKIVNDSIYINRNPGFLSFVRICFALKPSLTHGPSSSSGPSSSR